jgi:tetratricopeptide (TPR) repeat protein
MFERLINCGFPHVTLTTQRRMHPMISSLITPSIYPVLNDASTMVDRLSVRGIKERVFFLSHSVLEDSSLPAGRESEAANQSGRSNSHEAKILVAIAQHLLLNGYKPAQIVILSMYKQQLTLLRTLAKTQYPNSLLRESVSDVRMTTTDNYQGEECDIVLLSLVRSNTEEKAGFVKIANRVCVALSRARNGMYVVGNFEMIRKCSDLWETVCAKVESRDQLGAQLCLECSNHPQSSSLVSKAEDFAHSPNGGCMLPCGGSFPKCGHPCKLLCHPRSHDQICCPSPCAAPRPPGCTHFCPQPCWQECRPCAVKVPKVRDLCGHTLHIKCSEDVDEAECTHPCPVQMLCGHACTKACSHNHPSNYKCPQQCTRSRLTCKHPCPKKCSEACGDCMEKVTKVLACGHSVKVACSEDVSSRKCLAKCAKKLADCQHDCPKLCWEPCEVICQVTMKKKRPSCLSRTTHLVEEKCGVAVAETPCPGKCGMTLSCGHVCPEKCGRCMPPGSAGLPAAHPPCKKACDKNLPCNHKCGITHACGSVCPPCEKPCEISCGHGKCTLQCGMPCKPCQGRCLSTCTHVDCSELPCCQNPHDVSAVPPFEPVLCNIPCSLQLPCGHPCTGLCGEICPPLCKICSKKKTLTAMGALNEVRHVSPQLLESARLVVLACGHCFEVNALDALVLRQASQNRYPHCHTCKKTIQGVFRYSNVVRRSVARLQPPYYPLRELLLRSDFDKDMRLKNYKALTDRMRRLLHEMDVQFAKGIVGDNPLRPLVEFFLAKALVATTMLQEAEDCYRSALSSNGDVKLRAACANELGMLYMADVNNVGKAVKMFEQAVALDSECAGAASNLLGATDRLNEEKARLEQEVLQRAKEHQKEQEAARARAHADRSTKDAPVPPAPPDDSCVEEEEAARRLQEAVDAQELTRSGGTILHLAVLRDRIDEIKRLLKVDKSLASMQDNYGNTGKLSSLLWI